MFRVFSHTAGILLLLVLLAVPTRIFSAQEPAPVAPQRRQGPDEILARGRIEPLGRVIAINGPPDGASTIALVEKVLVEQGSKVEAGQVLAIINGFELSKTDLQVAKASLSLAERQRAQVQAGVGRAAEVAAQFNVIASRRAQLIRTRKDWERAFTLVRKKVELVQVLDTQQAALDQLTNDVQQAENALKALTEVRAVDDAVAEAQIAVGRANVAKAEAALARLQIRAPISGTVLSI